MKVGLIGLGNMGLGWLGSALLAGHTVVAVDKDQTKLEGLISGSLLRGEEPLWNEIVRTMWRRLSVSNSLSELRDVELVFIAVQTPFVDGRCDYSVLTGLLRSFQEYTHPGQTILLGSTVFPGAIHSHILPLIREGVVFAYEPVFLRAGTSVTDYCNPGKIVVGVQNPRCVSKTLLKFMTETRKLVPTYCTYAEAEFIKLVHNTFMCVKISFANEVAKLCHEHCVNPHRVMELTFTEEGANARLLTRSHMKPGPPYSGTCLPKDSRILMGLLGRGNYPLLRGAVDSNDDLVREIANFLRSGVAGHGGVGCVGLTYVQGYTDPRESLFIRLHRLLSEEGIRLLGYDPEFERLDSRAFFQYCRGDTYCEGLFADMTLSLPVMLERVSAIILNRTLSSDEAQCIMSSGLPVLNLYDGW